MKREVDAKFAYFLNILFRGIRKARANTQANNRHSETNLAVTLVSICTVFFVCHALRLYLGLKAVFLLDRTYWCMKEMKVCNDLKLITIGCNLGI